MSQRTSVQYNGGFRPPTPISKCLRIALLDADSAVRKSVHNIISAQHQWVLKTYSNAAKGLREISLCPPDAVLLEVELPDVSGVECLRKLRGLFPALPLIMLTARSDEKTIISSLCAGACLYLIKPTAPKTL